MIQLTTAGVQHVEGNIRDAVQLLESPAEQTAALSAGALLILNDAVTRAPYLTGNLRRSGRLDERTQGEVAVVFGGPGAPYARRIELGFSGQDSLGRRYNQPARPYLRPAFDAQQRAALGEIAHATQQLLRRAMS